MKKKDNLLRKREKLCGKFDAFCFQKRPLLFVRVCSFVLLRLERNLL
jgi:hypothetical protein